MEFYGTSQPKIQKSTSKRRCLLPNQNILLRNWQRTLFWRSAPIRKKLRKGGYSLNFQLPLSNHGLWKCCERLENWYSLAIFCSTKLAVRFMKVGPFVETIPSTFKAVLIEWKFRWCEIREHCPVHLPKIYRGWRVYERLIVSQTNLCNTQWARKRTGKWINLFCTHTAPFLHLNVMKGLWKS
jgi:hypothetical protein